MNPVAVTLDIIQGEEKAFVCFLLRVLAICMDAYTTAWGPPVASSFDGR